MDQNTLPNGLRSASQPDGSSDTTTEKWLIQKFGGTSVGKGPISIMDNVVRRVLFIDGSYSNRGFNCSTDRGFHMAELPLSAPHEVATPKQMAPPIGKVHSLFCRCCV